MHSYSTNTNRVKVYGLLAVVSVLVSIGVIKLLSYINLAPAWLISPPALAGIYTVLYYGVDKALWSWKPLRSVGLIDDIPINGIYTGELVSNYNHKALPVRIEVNQTWTKLLVELEVLEPKLSTSCSIAANVENMGNGSVKFTYTYRNNPNDGISDDDMQIHEGTAEVIIKPNGSANGRYFNSRGRKGTIRLNKNT